MKVDNSSGQVNYFKLFASSLLFLVSGQAVANSAGTDLNLTAKARAGGMGGAAYTRPQDPSAAVFGNPATLTQFKSFQVGFSASLLKIDYDHVEEFAGLTQRHTSRADDYILPDFGIVYPISPRLVFGTGLEIDAGIGADFRDDPITPLAGAAVALGFPEPLTLPVTDELVSINANLALAYEVTPQLSVGAALTIGFGLAQLGTVGDTTGMEAFDTIAALALGTPLGTFPNFGGTTADSHDIAVSASIGLTYSPSNELTLSGAVKGPHKYTFGSTLFTDLTRLGGTSGFTDFSLEQPMEVIGGIAYSGFANGNLLLEFDLVWKNWSDAEAYEDIYDDQTLLLFGAQYTMGPWQLRAGYKHHESLFLSTTATGDTVGSLIGVGTIPFGPTSPVGSDLATLIQNVAVPVAWEDTATIGIGYEFNSKVRVDAYFSYSFSADTMTTAPQLGALIEAALGLGLGDPVWRAELDSETVIGIGISFDY